MRLADEDAGSLICPRHALAESSVHESEIPDFSPDIREDVSVGSMGDDDSDYINAKQAVEYVNEQARALEAANERDRMIAAAEADAEEQTRIRTLRLAAIEKGLVDPAEGAEVSDNADVGEGGSRLGDGAA